MGDIQPLNRFEDHGNDVCHDQHQDAYVENPARPGFFRVRLEEMIDRFFVQAVYDYHLESAKCLFWLAEIVFILRG